MIYRSFASQFYKQNTCSNSTAVDCEIRQSENLSSVAFYLYVYIFGKGQTQLTLKIWIISFFTSFMRKNTLKVINKFLLLFLFTQETVWLSKTSAFTYYGNVGWHAFVRQATEECKLDQVTCWTKSKLWLPLFWLP